MAVAVAVVVAVTCARACACARVFCFRKPIPMRIHVSCRDMAQDCALSSDCGCQRREITMVMIVMMMMMVVVVVVMVMMMVRVVQAHTASPGAYVRARKALV